MSLRSLISRLTSASLKHWRSFLVAAALLTGLGLWLASHLEVRSSFEELLPVDVPSVRNAKELGRRVGGDGTVLVMIETSDDPARDPEALKRAQALASELADQFRAMPDVIRAVEADIRPTERWYADHWPMFLPLDKLQRAHDELVKALGEAKAKVNPLLDLGEEPAAAAEGGPRVAQGVDEKPAALNFSQNKDLEELLDPNRPSPKAKVEEGFARFKGGYLVHPDGRSVSILLRPTGTSLGVSEVRVVLDKLQAVIDGHAAEIKAGKLKVAFGGSYPVLLAEYESIIKGALLGFALVMAIVLLSIAIFYWEVRAVVVIGGILIVGIAVTFGLTWLVIGYLNTQTAFLGSIVAGNGLNYGVVYLARVGQLRRQRVALAEACHEAAQVAARATLLAAVGTSVAFGTLLVATNRGFRHFGFIGGVGMVLCWAATFVFTPALLVLLERLHPHPGRGSNPWHGVRTKVLEHAFARPRLLIAIFSALTAIALGIFLHNLPNALERNLNNLTNDEIGSQEMRRNNDRAQGAIGQSIAGAIALLPSREAAESYCDAIRARIAAQPGLGDIIQECNTVATVVPSHQPQKLALLRDVRERLTDRVLARLTPAQAARAREIRDQLADQRVLADEQAPQSLVDRFRERDGTVGRIAFVRAQPGARLEEGPRLRIYASAVRRVPVSWIDEKTGEAKRAEADAAGADIVIADLLEDIERQGPRVTLLSFVCVCALVVAFFRTWGRSVLLLVSLVAGVALMAGIATLAHIKINFFNFIVYPITFGIAVDYGANVLSRMGVRRNVLPALGEVGGAVILCSWTTILGYGSLILSFNRALRSFGWYAMLGEFTTLVTALVLLPAMALVVSPRRWLPVLQGEGDALDGAMTEAGHGGGEAVTSEERCDAK